MGNEYSASPAARAHTKIKGYHLIYLQRPCSPSARQSFHHAQKAAFEVTTLVLFRVLSALQASNAALTNGLLMPNPAIGILERNEFPYRDGVSRFGSMRLSDGSFNGKHWTLKRVTRPGRRAKGSLQQAASAQTVARKRIVCISP
jgi:hypothetical protein